MVFGSGKEHLAWRRLRDRSSGSGGLGVRCRCRSRVAPVDVNEVDLGKRDQCIHGPHGLRIVTVILLIELAGVAHLTTLLPHLGTRENGIEAWQ